MLAHGAATRDGEEVSNWTTRDERGDENLVSIVRQRVEGGYLLWLRERARKRERERQKRPWCKFITYVLQSVCCILSSFILKTVIFRIIAESWKCGRVSRWQPWHVRASISDFERGVVSRGCNKFSDIVYGNVSKSSENSRNHRFGK